MPDLGRRPNRLRHFDYTGPAAYFLTLCANEKQLLFRTGIDAPLTDIGLLTEQAIAMAPGIHTGVQIDRYVIMPNHIHMILITDPGNNHSISTIIGQMKRYVTVQSGQTVWQRSFHDHVIRNEADLLRIRTYIENNPKSRLMDRFYRE